jgi:SAM-dependent methyltransferase
MIPENIPAFKDPHVNNLAEKDNVICPVCTASRISLLFESSDRNRRTTKKKFAVYSCNVCHTGITAPQLSGEELSSAYPKIYYNLDAFRDLDIKTSRFYSFQYEKIEKIKKVAEGGTLLDVGCGVGSFVLISKEYGYEAEGIEMSHEAVEFGRSNFHVLLNEGDILSYPLKDNNYDIVTMWHVLEHLPNPNDVLRKIHPKLKSNGILAIAVPNFSSIQAKIFRSRWYHLDVPRHLFHYSLQGLVELLSKTGFTVEVVDHFSLEHNWAGINGSIFDLHSLTKESIIHKIVRKTIGYYLSYLLAWIESMFQRGGTVTVIARKITK